MVFSFKTTLLRLGYRYFAKPAFFLQDPETVHDRMIQAGEELGKYSLTRTLVRSLFYYQSPALEQTVAGMRFSNPVGLSAGFDKDARLINILPSVGFGFIQAGSVTTKPYGGNPKPRLYRLKKSKGIVVYYGLKNEGVLAISERIKNTFLHEVPLSISIAKTNADFTKTDEAGIADYTQCLLNTVQKSVGDFYTINISCPNTFGGEPFTTPEKLEKLLSSLKQIKTEKPMFIKMPIDLEWQSFRTLLEVIVRHKIAGVIIGNLAKDRSNRYLKDHIPEKIKGGMSGKLTWDLSNELISQTYQSYGNKLTIIGVGGIFSAPDAYEKIKRGATLLQLITGMIFEGPQLVGEINRGLVSLLKKDGYKNISEAVGAYHRKKDLGNLKGGNKRQVV